MGGIGGLGYSSILPVRDNYCKCMARNDLLDMIGIESWLKFLGVRVSKRPCVVLVLCVCDQNCSLAGIASGLLSNHNSSLQPVAMLTVTCCYVDCGVQKYMAQQQQY